MRLLDVALSPEQVKSLDEASTIDLGFPYSMYSKEMVRYIATAASATRLWLEVGWRTGQVL